MSFFAPLRDSRGFLDVTEAKIRDLINSVLKEPTQPIPKSRNLQILEAKIKMIETTYDEFYFVATSYMQYANNRLPGEKYSDFAVRYREDCINRLKAEGKSSVIEYRNKNDLSLVTLNMLSSPHYSPLEGKTLSHLMTLWQYWTQCRPSMPYSLEIPNRISDDALDLALAKLIRSAQENINWFQYRGERDLTRSTNSAQSRRAKADPKKDWVCQIYGRSSKIEIGMRLNKIATMIKKEFARLKEGEDPQIPSEIEVPSLDSIKDYLKNNPDLWREFQPEGRFWVKKM